MQQPARFKLRNTFVSFTRLHCRFSGRESVSYSGINRQESFNLTLSLLSDQCQNSPAASQEIWHHTVWRTWLFIAYSDEKWLYYKFLLHTHTIAFWKVGRIHFLSSGVKGLIHNILVYRALRSWAPVCHVVGVWSLPTPSPPVQPGSKLLLWCISVQLVCCCHFSCCCHGWILQSCNVKVLSEL